VKLGAMTDAQRSQLRTQLRGDAPANEIPFAQPGSRTRVYAVASGKGGVGKSSVTVNLAVALAQQGLSVGVVDADIYGFSVPRMLGVTGKPTQVDQMIMPPTAHGVKVISIGMFTPGNTAVVWRGPMLHRALQQFLADVFWGELDVLLMDLPARHRRHRDLGRPARPIGRAARRHHTAAGRARGRRARRLDRAADPPADRRRGREHELAGLPDGTRMELFGSGGGQAVADSLSATTGTTVPLLGQIPIDQLVREGGDGGDPIVLSDPSSAAAIAMNAIADKLAARQHSLVGRSLGLAPARG
jgi:ATPases involved in chromosome partitioning